MNAEQRTAYIERFTERCKDLPALLGVFATQEDRTDRLLLCVVCSDRGFSSLLSALTRVAARCGTLIGQLPLPEGDAHCFLYEEQPQLVTVRAVAETAFEGLSEQDIVVWEWNNKLSSVRTASPPDVRALLQLAEERVWVEICRAALAAKQGCLFEAVDRCAVIRNTLLLPLLGAYNKRAHGQATYRAGGYAEQLVHTHPHLSEEGVLDALEAMRQMYFAVRYELAFDDFVRNEQAELLATALLR